MPLKLQFHKGDRVLIGEDILVEMLSTGRTVQLQFQAPQDVRIVRLPTDISHFGANATGPSDKVDVAGNRSG
jgi:hypothetical protein